jgi:peptide chain release factor subunit 1
MFRFVYGLPAARRIARAMARTVTWDELRSLASFRAQRGCAISLYLDLDPADSPTPRTADMRLNSLLDEAGKAQRSNGANLSHDARVGLRNDVERIRAYFDAEFDRDGAHGLALFCDGLDGVWESLALIDAVPDAVTVAGRFQLSPLVQLVGRGEGALVVFVGREQGRFYRMRAGRLREVTDLWDEQHGKHDQGGWSQARYQRHIEKLVGDHLREVAEEIDRRVRRENGKVEVVIVSPEETRAELGPLLSHDVKSAIVGWTSGGAHVSAAGLEELVKPILDRSRAEAERELVDRWREAVGRNGRAAAGWETTLEAASDARVETLLVSNGANREAWRCPECGRGSAVPGECALDGTAMQRVENGLDVAVHLTLLHGGRVKVLEHVQDLGPAAGIGALLRF